MVVDRGGHFFRFPLGLGIEPAHDPLQFREFLDHLRRQIAFAKIDRPEDVLAKSLGIPAPHGRRQT